MNKFLLPKAEINNRHFKSLGGKSGEQGLWGKLWALENYHLYRRDHKATSTFKMGQILRKDLRSP